MTYPEDESVRSMIYNEDLPKHTSRPKRVKHTSSGQRVRTGVEKSSRRGNPTRVNPTSKTFPREAENCSTTRRHGKNVLVLVEGPFDALKLDYFGQFWGLRAVGILGLSYSPGKIIRVSRLIPNFLAVGLIEDPEAIAEGIAISNHLTSLGVEQWDIPSGVEDPGDLHRRQVEQLARELVSRAEKR